MAKANRKMRDVLAENDKLRSVNEELSLRLSEAEETLRAIHSGEVDALVVESPQGPRIFTLEGAEHPYRVLVESMNEGAATLSVDGTIRYCNNRLATMLHVPLERLLGTSLTSYVYVQDASIFMTLLERCREKEGAAEIRIMTSEGESVPVLFSCRGLEPNGAGLGAVITDLSERRHKDQIIASTAAELETTLEDLHEKEHLLLMQSRMAAMGQMIGNIAHQWRQPLNALSLTVQQLRVLYEVGRFDKEVLDKSVDNSMKLIQHMSDTINDFRNFFRKDKDKVEFNVKETVNKALKLLDGVLKHHGIKVLTEMSEDLHVFGYPNEYAQVILNIVTNAKDAFAERKSENPTIVIIAVHKAEKSVVTVRDNAGGIARDVIGKIFEPHFSTKGPQGTGIGLFMAKTIVERNMGGRLRVRNVPKGAEFTVEV